MKDNLIYGFECSGHTGYAEFGKDILCATISAISQSTILGITNVLGIKCKIDRVDDKGYIKIELPNNIDSIKSAQVLLQTMKVSIEDLLEAYSHYISMEVIEDVY